MIVIDNQETLDSYLQLKPVKKWKRTKVSCFCNTCKKYKVQMLQSIILPFKCKDCKHSETMLKEETQEKYKKTYQEKYGCDYGFQSKEIKRKSEQTKIKLYGDKNYTNKEKMKETNLKLYGSECVLSNKEIQEKIKTTCKERYGEESYIKTTEMREKSIQTMKDKYNVEYTAQSKELRNKMEQSCLVNYGVKYPYQNYEIYNKSQFKKIKYDNITFDSKWELYYYKYLKESQINFIYHPKMNLWYEFNGKKHKYYPDFYLIDEQKIVEIKSDYLYNEMLKENTKENEKLKLMKSLNVIILQSKELKEIGII